VAETFRDAFSLVIPCDRDAPRKVRGELDKVGAIAGARDDIKLAASELVSNAVLHSGCTPRHRIEIHGRLTSHVFELTVHDPGLSGKTSRIRHERQELEVGGLGMRIVDQLASCWGVEDPDGHLVWAQFSI
jgi:anti-sigma regulatory factor (Ser/Thr protein kinase)